MMEDKNQEWEYAMFETENGELVPEPNVIFRIGVTEEQDVLAKLKKQGWELISENDSGKRHQFHMRRKIENPLKTGS